MTATATTSKVTAESIMIARAIGCAFCVIDGHVWRMDWTLACRQVDLWRTVKVKAAWGRFNSHRRTVRRRIERTTLVTPHDGTGFTY